MMLHRHFENENKPNLTTSQDLMPRRGEEEDPLFVPTNGEEMGEEPVPVPAEGEEMEEEPQAPRRGKGRRGGVPNG